MPPFFSNVGRANVLDTVAKGVDLYNKIEEEPAKLAFLNARARDAIYGDFVGFGERGIATSGTPRETVARAGALAGVGGPAAVGANPWAGGTGGGSLPPSKAPVVPLDTGDPYGPDRAIPEQVMQQVKADTQEKMVRATEEAKPWDHQNDPLLNKFLPISKAEVSKMLVDKGFVNQDGTSTQGQRWKAIQAYAEDKGFGDAIDQMRAKDAQDKFTGAQMEYDKLWAEASKPVNLGNPEHQAKVLEARRKMETTQSEYAKVNEQSNRRMGMRELLPVVKGMAEGEGISLEEMFRKYPELQIASEIGSAEAMKLALPAVQSKQELRRIWETQATPEERRQLDIAAAMNTGKPELLVEAIRSYRAQITSKEESDARRLDRESLLLGMRGTQASGLQTQKDEAAMERLRLKLENDRRLKGVTGGAKDIATAHKMHQDFEKTIGSLRKQMELSGDPTGQIQDSIENYQMAQQRLLGVFPGLGKIFDARETSERKRGKDTFTAEWNRLAKDYATALRSGSVIVNGKAVTAEEFRRDLEDQFIYGQELGFVDPTQGFAEWIDQQQFFRILSPREYELNAQAAGGPAIQ